MCNHLDHNQIQQMMCNIEAAAKGALPDALVQVTDPMGNGHHFNVIVTSPSFEGLSIVEQHRKVYAALTELLSRELHSVVIKTRSKE